MLHIDADTRYYWYQHSADFRKGFDGLCSLVKEHMRREVVEGGVFIYLWVYMIHPTKPFF